MGRRRVLQPLKRAVGQLHGGKTEYAQTGAAMGEMKDGFEPSATTHDGLNVDAQLLDVRQSL